MRPPWWARPTAAALFGTGGLWPVRVHGAADEASLEATRDQVLRRDADDATVSSFHVAADGVLQLDSSHLDFEQTVRAVLDAIVEQAPAGADAGRRT